MFEKFGDYMFYLLSSPFKKVQKVKNQWYIFFKVIGKLFDKNKEMFFLAREETMVATASEQMLIEHARDRGLTRYANESTENFRKRIALYEEICRQAGSNEGIMLAVKALGYKSIQSIPCCIVDGNRERWAEFYVMIEMNVDDIHPISFGILKNVVRKIKNVGGKDNYRFIYDLQFDTEIVEYVDSQITNRYSFNWWDIKVMFDGSIVFDGTSPFDSQIALVKSSVTNRLVFDNSLTEDFEAKVTIKDNLWYFDGSYSFDGTMMPNAVFKEESL